MSDLEGVKFEGSFGKRACFEVDTIYTPKKATTAAAAGVKLGESLECKVRFYMDESILTGANNQDLVNNLTNMLSGRCPKDTEAHHWNQIDTTDGGRIFLLNNRFHEKNTGKLHPNVSKQLPSTIKRGVFGSQMSQVYKMLARYYIIQYGSQLTALPGGEALIQSSKTKKSTSSGSSSGSGSGGSGSGGNQKKKGGEGNQKQGDGGSKQKSSSKQQSSSQARNYGSKTVFKTMDMRRPTSLMTKASMGLMRSSGKQGKTLYDGMKSYSKSNFMRNLGGNILRNGTQAGLRLGQGHSTRSLGGIDITFDVAGVQRAQAISDPILENRVSSVLPRTRLDQMIAETQCLDKVPFAFQRFDDPFFGTPGYSLSFAVLDSVSNKIILVGSPCPYTSQKQVIGVSQSMLFTALRAELLGTNIQFSLDPLDKLDPRGKYLKKVFIPESVTSGTHLGDVLFQSDFAMKQYSFGRISTTSSGKSLIPGMKSEFDLLFEKSTRESPAVDNWNRMWLSVERADCRTSDTSFKVENIKMKVNASRQETDPTAKTGLKDVETSEDDVCKRFAELFTKNYDYITQESPIFGQLKEVVSAIAISRWIYSQNKSALSKSHMEWFSSEPGYEYELLERKAAASESVEALHASEESQGIVHTSKLHLFGGVDMQVQANSIGQSQDNEFATEIIHQFANISGDEVVMIKSKSGIEYACRVYPFCKAYSPPANSVSKLMNMHQRAVHELNNSVNPDAALKIFQECTDSFPGWSKLWLGCGECYQWLGKFDEALVCLRKAKDLINPTDYGSKLALSHLTMSCYLESGMMAEASREARHCKQLLESIKADAMLSNIMDKCTYMAARCMNLENWQVDAQKAEEEKIRGNEFLQQQNYYPQKAIEKYSRAIELNPYNPVFYKNRCVVHLSLWKHQRTVHPLMEALKDACRMIFFEKDDPFSFVGYLQKGKVLQCCGHYKEALESLIEGYRRISSKPQDRKEPEFTNKGLELRNRGNELMKAQLHQMAFEKYTEALVHEKGRAKAVLHFNRGVALTRIGGVFAISKAVADFESAIKEDKQYFKAYKFLAENLDDKQRATTVMLDCLALFVQK